MPNPTDTLKPMTNLKADLLSRSSMTPIERLHGRFMRAPDHDAATGGGDAGGDQGTDDGDKGDQSQDKGADAENQGADEDSTILGGEDAGDAGKGSDGENKDEGDKKEAALEVPETYDLKPPAGFEKLDTESLNEVTPLLKELGASNEKAQTLIDHAGKFAQRIQTQQQQHIMDEVNKTRAEWAEAAKKDPEIGGDKWGETLELSAKALDTLGYPKGSEFRNFLTDSGLGNHPEMIRAMRKIGTLVGEDNDFVRGNAGAASKLDRLSVLYPDDVAKQESA